MASNYLAADKAEKSINILDVLKYLAFHWKWFLLSVVVFGGLYLYQYNRTPFMYRQSETVMIKTQLNTPTSARLTRTNMVYNSVSVASEILQLRSKELMRHTISKIQGDVSYTVRKGLRYNELYTASPVQVEVLGQSPEYSYSLTVVPVDSQRVWIHYLDQEGQEKKQQVELNKETNSAFGRLLITPRSTFTQDYFGVNIQVVKYPRETMVGYYMSNLQIQQIEDEASLLNVSIEDKSRKRAADLITALIDVYNIFSREDKNQIAHNTAAFIRGRLQIIENELGSVESDIERLRTSNQGVDVASEGQMYVADHREFQSEREKIETDIRLVEMMREYLSDQQKQNELIPNNTGLVETSIEQQIVEYNTSLLRRNRLIEGSSSEHPVVKDLDKALGAMRANIGLAVENKISGLKIKLQNIHEREEQARSKAMRVPQKQRLMLSVERQQKVKEELYLFLLNKREENALNQAMSEDNIRIIDPASGAISPTYPSLPRKALMGIAIGLMLPAIVLILLWIVDTSVQGRQDVEKEVNTPFLGEIPLSKHKKHANKDVIVTPTGREPLTEAFRILRTNISFMTKEGQVPKVVTLTSFKPGVGKTFTALNLGATLAFLGKKVVLLDLDLRKGTLSSRIGIVQDKGMSHYLSSADVEIGDIIYSTSFSENLHMIPIGIIAPNPVELLLSKRLDDLLKVLKQQFDYIVVDGVPVGMVADATIMNRISELTLFIIRVGQMDRRQLPELERIYQENKLFNMAIVLNGLKPNTHRYGYSYGYGYGGYGYGYGYHVERSIWARLFAKGERIWG